ncbi:hypothetical protein OSJ00_22645, partial [Mycobacterium ulcerans]
PVPGATIAATATVTDPAGIPTRTTRATGHGGVKRGRPGTTRPAITEQQTPITTGPAGHHGHTRVSPPGPTGTTSTDQPGIPTTAGRTGGRGRRPRAAITE